MNIFGVDLSSYFLTALTLLGVCAAIVFVYMLFRILNEQESIFKEIRKGTKNLIEAGEKLHSMYSLAEGLIDKLQEVRSSTVPQPLTEIDQISQELITRNIKK